MIRIKWFRHFSYFGFLGFPAQNAGNQNVESQKLEFKSEADKPEKLESVCLSLCLGVKGFLPRIILSVAQK